MTQLLEIELTHRDCGRVFDEADVASLAGGLSRILGDATDGGMAAGRAALVEAPEMIPAVSTGGAVFRSMLSTIGTLATTPGEATVSDGTVAVRGTTVSARTTGESAFCDVATCVARWSSGRLSRRNHDPAASMTSAAIPAPFQM